MAEAVVITADILTQNPGPALSATSDMPVLASVEEAENTDAAPPAPEGSEAAAETPAAEGEGGETGAEDEGGEAAAAVEGDKPTAKPKPGINERFSTLTEQRKAAEARADRLERLLEQALTRIPAAQPAEEPAVVAPPPPAAEPRPQRETFDSPDAYDEALIEWSTKRSLQIARAEQEVHTRAEREAAERQRQTTEQTRSLQTIQEAHATRRAAAIEARPDYVEVAERDDLRISMPMAMAIMESEDGPDAALYLGEHPDLAEKISGMVVPGQVFPAGHAFAGQPVPDVNRQMIEMGKVFAAVAKPETPATPEPPPPPRPINPIRRGNNAAVTRTLAELGNDGTMEEYAARRLAELRAPH